MQMTIYISPEGREYSTLPRTWNNATNITPAWALANGWRTEEREVSPSSAEQPKRYSKYALHKALDRAGIWDVAWSAIVTAGYSQYWNDAQNLCSDDEIFTSALAALEEAITSGTLELPQGTTIESILEEARKQ